MRHDDFWDVLDDTRTGMLDVGDRFVPMAHYPDHDTNCICFISAQDTDAARAAGRHGMARYVVYSDKDGSYTDIRGKLSISNDRQRLENIWNAVAASWFGDSLKDPNLRLVQLHATSAELWKTGGSLRFIYEIAKAQATNEEPDMGEHAILNFA